MKEGVCPSCAKLCFNKARHQSAPLCPRSPDASPAGFVTVPRGHHLAHLPC